MTLEAERGCGFRKPGGLYLVGSGLAVPCDRLPFPIVPCECCGFEPQQVRSHAWVPAGYIGEHRVTDDSPSYAEWLGHKVAFFPDFPKKHRACPDVDGFRGQDPLCSPQTEKRLLMWVGGRFYDPSGFVREAELMGVSKRIAEIPYGLKVGETWVLLAHPEACYEPVSWAFHWMFEEGEVLTAPGIFYAFRPQRVERILHEAEATEERIAAEKAKGIDVVIIPEGAEDARVSWRPGEPRPADAGPTREEVADAQADEAQAGPSFELPLGSGGPRPTGEGWSEYPDVPKVIELVWP